MSSDRKKPLVPHFSWLPGVVQSRLVSGWSCTYILYLYSWTTQLKLTIQRTKYNGVQYLPFFPMVLDLLPSFSSAIRSVRALSYNRALLFLIYYPNKLILLLTQNLFWAIQNLWLLYTIVRKTPLMLKEFWKIPWVLVTGLWWETCSHTFCESFVLGEIPLLMPYCASMKKLHLETN